MIHNFQGRPLLFHVYDQVRKARLIDRVIIATDSRQVLDVVAGFNGEAVLTSNRHRTGTDRVAEVVQKMGGDIVINIQADNLGLKARVLDNVIRGMLANSRIEFATLAHRIMTDEDLSNPNVVKIIINRNNRAMWFSRFPIPYIKQTERGSLVKQYPYWAHIGIYFFRRRALNSFTRWKRSPSEKAESLEQLRILENGAEIFVYRTSMKSFSIDTPQDLKNISRVYR